MSAYAPRDDSHLEDLRYDEDVQRRIDDAREDGERLERLLKDPDWWDQKLGGLLGIDAARVLARCMVELDAAVKGDPTSRECLLLALSGLQLRARNEVRDEA